ncbi:MAG TPA: mycofactocin biosynthesis glycosyltransferase MftF, partial [Candidatus Dormibacteraeota bacterium]|nr:mycofactocin biosynthesis glycosyltransferase MftF [Candidatus Dormibacteraeota bacterium]
MSGIGLPAGFGVALDPRLRRLEDGRVLIGGSPPRLLRLSDAGARAVDRLAAGAAVPAAGGGTAALARRLVAAGMAHPRPPRPPFAAPHARVAVVIPVRDRPAELARALAGLGAVAEVVVVDDGSADARAAARVAADAGARLVRAPRPEGPAAARNRGLRATSAPLVAFVDSDCELGPGWLDGLLPHLDDPAVGLVAPRVAAPAAASGDGLLARYERVRSPLDMGARESAVAEGAAVPYVPAAVLLVRREAALAAGGFDERMRVGEDVDFVWRLVTAGWLARYEPAVEVLHAPRTRLRDWLGRRAAYGSSAAALARRHPGRLAAIRLHPAAALGWGLLLAGRPLSAGALGAVGTLRLARRLGPLEHPWREAARLTAAGQGATAGALAAQLARTWWPAAVLAAALAPRTRRPLVAAAVLPALLDWGRRRPDLDPLLYCGLHLLDAAAY